jgi:alkaline phosphatase D
MSKDITSLLMLNRRWLFKGLGASALTGASLAPITAVWAAPVFFSDPFTLGVASGDPDAGGFVIWTKIAPEPLSPGFGLPAKALEVGWQVARDDRMRDIVARGTTIARPELGHSVHVEVSGLEPAREYHYRFTCGTERSPIGRAKTFPAAGASPDMSFGVVGCQRYEHGNWAAYRDVAEAQPDFVYHYGDYIYEGRAVKMASDTGRYVRELPGLPQECMSLPDYRLRYAIYKMDPNLQAAHAATSFLHSFDDHEVLNDWTSEKAANSDTPADIFLLRRAAAWQAWYENLPVRKAQMPRGPDLAMHRRFDIGGLMRFNVLDTRQFRKGHFCAGKRTDQCGSEIDPSLTMLGQAQEKWLEEGLKDTTRPWTVLGQQVLMTENHRENKPDKWDRAPAARKRLFDALQASKAPSPIVLTGDVHYSSASELKADFGKASSATVGIEFGATSISSHSASSNNKKWMEQTLADLSYIKHLEARRGWTLHKVTPKLWTAEHRTVSDHNDPASKVKASRSFIVEAGKLALTEA